MRRGLIAQSRAELPDAVLDARIARVRVAMDAAGLDEPLLYTNNTRPAAVSWLTGFVPYSSEALLILAGDGLPLLVTALTYRVKGWIERTSRLCRRAAHAARRARSGARDRGAQSGCARRRSPISMLCPPASARTCARADRASSVRDASALFARMRGAADAAEIAFAARASASRLRALAQPRRRLPCGHDRGGGPRGALARRRGGLRRGGARSCARSAARAAWRETKRARHNLRAARHGCLRGTWIRLVRTFAPRTRAMRPRAFSQRRPRGFPMQCGFAGFTSWLVEGCRIAQPLEPLAGTRVNARDRVATRRTRVGTGAAGGRRWIGAGRRARRSLVRPARPRACSCTRVLIDPYGRHVS